MLSLDEAVQLKAQEGHGVRLFRGLSEAIIGKCLTVERVGYVEDPSLVSACTTPFQSSAGRSTSVAWVKDSSLWTVALLRTFCVEHGLGRFCFFSFIFLSPNAPMRLSASASSFLIDAGTSARPA